MMKVFYSILIIIIVSVLLLLGNSILSKFEVVLHKNIFVNKLLKFQAYALLIALIVMGLTIVMTPLSKMFLKVGDFNTIAIKETWLGINGTSSWLSNGVQLAFFISLATGVFMFMAVKGTNSFQNFQIGFIPIIILISLSNSFSEEIIYRFAIVGNLNNNLPRVIILVISAILFGLPHYAGYPNGIIGVLMASVLGYVLSKATIETNGIGLAWFIHFLQDVIIFTALFMMNVKEDLGKI